MGKSERHSETKLRTEHETVSMLRKKNRQLEQRVKSLEASRTHQRHKVKKLRMLLKSYKQTVKRRDLRAASGSQYIEGHKYSSSIVALSMCLLAYGGCSFRGVRRVLLCLQLELGLFPGDLPSKSSISNWSQKLGQYVYESGVGRPCGPYSIILDESMVFGQERLLVALGVPAQKAGEEALGLRDVWVLGVSARTSWKWEEVRDFLLKVEGKMGTKAVYVVSDGGVSLKKGVAEAGLTRVNDIGHELCMYTDQCYRQDHRYKTWAAEVAKVRFQVYMTGSAYLMPPKQRTVARFINLSHAVRWSIKMLRAMPTLRPDEQKTFGWLREHEEFVQEFESVIQLNESIMEILKNKGLSHENIDNCLKICTNATKTAPQKHKEKIVAYLQSAKQQLPKATATWHTSSDVLESLFGRFKQTAPDNPLNGMGTRMLSLCLLTNGNCQPGEDLERQAKIALESISMSKIAVWKEANLIENQLIKRRNVLQK